MKRAGMVWLCGLLLCLLFPSVASPAGESAGNKNLWSEVRPGLSLARFNADHEPVEGIRSTMEDPGLTVLRIDPEVYRFRLLSVSELDTESLDLAQWTEKFGLHAVINAGMFWEDQRTSSGYMRNFEHLNQSRIHPDYGGFLVFNPRRDELPRIQIVDRYNRSDWKRVIEQYASVVQNFRLIGRKGTIAWHEEGEPYSASCIAEDTRGRILFIHNLEQQTMKSLSRLLVELPLDIDICLFTEGGDHAGLRLDTPPVQRSWPRASDKGFWASRKTIKIPNVVGIEPRKRSTR